LITREELALKGLAMLDKQRKYFKTRSPIMLEESKTLERSFKHECQRILEGPELFKEGDAS